MVLSLLLYSTASGSLFSLHTTHNKLVVIVFAHYFCSIQCVPFAVRGKVTSHKLDMTLACTTYVPNYHKVRFVEIG